VPEETAAERGRSGGALLEGKVAMVTGGSRGLGFEMAKGLGDAGAHIVVASRKGDVCQAVAEEIEARFGHRALGVTFHAGDWESCDRLVEKVYEVFGKIDVLVNNAGMSPRYPSVEKVDQSLFDKVIAVNLRGPFRLCALVGSRMAAAGGGSIINVSSIAAERPYPNAIPYSAAKAGLNALTVAFAHAFGPNVRVNAIQAGPFLTDISKAWDMDAVQAELDHYALRRAGQPAEVVGAVLYLASSQSSFTTGAILRVDGGHP
jgi:NAD(P)-dependent dehydrogenase (short-subunit alcohol dehydrogenase family)